MIRVRAIVVGAAGVGANATLTGDYNVGVGYKALYEGTSGQKNTAVGTESLEKNKYTLRTRVMWLLDI